MFCFSPRRICLFVIVFLSLALLQTAPAHAGDGSAGSPFTSLSEAYSATSSGRYFFDLGSGVFEGDVDVSEGGGWVLVLQYNHAGGTNPALDVKGAGDNLPITSIVSLGANESNDLTRWGHAGNAAMNQFPGDLELRWYGETSNQGRTVHFRSAIGDDYVRTGTGSFSGINNNFTALLGHSANIPANASAGSSNQGDGALTELPFFSGNGENHWAIRAEGNRWEVDDFADNASQNTIHRVWVRDITPPDPLVVTSTADTDTFGTLRFAINHANANPGDDNIAFNIAGAGPHRIAIGSSLPTLNDTGISVDATTQSGASCGDLWAGTPPVLQVHLDDGGSVSSGLTIRADNVSVRGLSITNFSQQIDASRSSDDLTLQCNYIGLTPDGTGAGGTFGIRAAGANLQVGGLTAGDGNVIGDNALGLITSSGTSNINIQGNFIGTDPTGLLARRNRSSGITQLSGSASVNEIRRNLISGNAQGILLDSGDTWTGVGMADFIIAGNYIGTDLTGSVALPNTGDGISFAAGTVNGLVIGGTDAADRNVISGNGANGVEIVDQSDIAIFGNYIGVGADGLTALGNGANGIVATGATTLDIGDGTASGRNIISANLSHGISLDGTIDGVVIDGNYIGLAADGTIARGNGASFEGSGINLENTTVSDGEIIRNNVIAANGINGITVNGAVDNLTITSNYIGTDATGDVAVNNDHAGIFMSSTGGGHQIGSPSAGNVITTDGAFDQSSGIEFTSAVTSATVQANTIGLGANGTTVFETASWGIRSRAASAMIGGTGAGEGNTIVGVVPGWAGLLIQGGANIVSGNTIRDGLGYAGVNITSNGNVVTFHNNIVSGEAGAGIQVDLGAQLIAYENIITGNGGDGIFLNSATAKAAIYANAISSNGGLGIDLLADGVTPNDSGDVDAGANDLLNFPVINTLTADGTTAIDYDINLDAPADANGYRIDFYKNSVFEANGEGETHLGFVDVAHTGGDVNFTGSFTANATLSDGEHVSATTTSKTSSTSYDITSEFSLTMTLGGSASLTASESLAPLIVGDFMVPGNDVLYSYNVMNEGTGSVSEDSIILIIAVPDEATFFYGDYDGPGPSTDMIGFDETGTTLNFDPSTDARYFNGASKPASLAECDYSPTDGYDVNVTYVCLNPKGELQGGDTNPNFTISFRARIN